MKKVAAVLKNCKNFGKKCITASLALLNNAKTTLQRMDGEQVSCATIFAGLFLIKYLFILVTYLCLRGRLYVPGVEYGVVFVWWKELIASVVFAGMTYFFIQIKFTNGILSNIMLFLYVLSYIPINSAFALQDAPVLFFLLTTIYYFALLGAVKIGNIWMDKFAAWCKGKGLNRRIGKLARKTLEGDNGCEDIYVRLFCVAVCLLLIWHKVSYNGLSFSFLIDSDSVYATRASYLEYTESISGTPIAYIVSLVRNLAATVMPFYLLASLIRKKPVGVIISGVSVLSLYAISSLKTDLFMLAVVICLYVCYRFDFLRHFQKIFLLGMIAYMCVCLLEVIVRGGNSTLYSLLGRRMMYLPTDISINYFDFFSQNEKIFWRQDVFLLKMFIEPVYDKSILSLINETYYAGWVPSPNTGMFAEAYMHFGVIGVVLYPVILSIVINIYSRVCKPYGEAIGVLMAILLVLSLVDVPIVWTETILGRFLFPAFLFGLSLLPIPRPKEKYKII